MIAPGSVATIVSISRACDRAAPSHGRDRGAHGGHARRAPVGVGCRGRRFVQAGRQRAERELCIAGDGDLGAGVAHQLLRVDVDADQSTVDREAAVERDVVISFAQLGADGEHHVGIADRRTGGRQRLGRADQQRVAGRQQPRVDRQRDRRVQAFGEFAQFRRRVDRAAAGEDQRPARVREQAGGRGERVRIRRGRAGSAGGASDSAGAGITITSSGISICTGRGRAGEDREGAREDLRQVGRVEQRVRERGESWRRAATAARAGGRRRGRVRVSR